MWGFGMTMLELLNGATMMNCDALAPCQDFNNITIKHVCAFIMIAVSQHCKFRRPH